MQITDKRVIRILSRIKNAWCVEDVETFPEDERNGQSDMDILKDEIYYIIERFEDSEGALGSEYAEALEIMKKTKNGKVMPYTFPDFEPLYEQYEVNDAKALIAEYKQLKYYHNKLRGVK